MFYNKTINENAHCLRQNSAIKPINGPRQKSKYSIKLKTTIEVTQTKNNPRKGNSRTKFITKFKWNQCFSCAKKAQVDRGTY